MSGASGGRSFNSARVHCDRAGQVGVEHGARNGRIAFGLRLVPQHAVSDQDLVRLAEARTQVARARLDGVERGEIDLDGLGGGGAAHLEILGDGREPVQPPAGEDERGALARARPRVGLGDRGGGSQHQDAARAAAASAVTRLQKSDMMAGSRNASTRRQSG